MFALTSLSPSHHNAAEQERCIASWRRAGLDVRAFNHPSEIASLRGRYDVTFVPVKGTTEQWFGKPLVPIHTMLRWAAAEQADVLLINSDIELDLAPWELRRIRHLSAGGLAYFSRHDHDGDRHNMSREPNGIDAFLLHGSASFMFTTSFFSMGQPFWDYWVPYTFLRHGLPVFAVEFPCAFHRRHPQQWSLEAWDRCATEFCRAMRLVGIPKSHAAYDAMAREVRAQIDRKKRPLERSTRDIRAWVEKTFCGHRRKTIFELGAHDGSDTSWLSDLRNTTVHAFEPDPRNTPPPRANVVLNRAAIADREGPRPFILSESGWGQPWTYSSSLRRPKNHLHRYPVTFGSPINVEATSLDIYRRRHGLGDVDFIWADVQGAEGDMVRGGYETLSRTRYLYTAYSNDEMYEGQWKLGDILRALPAYRVMELYETEVLLRNMARA